MPTAKQKFLRRVNSSPIFGFYLFLKLPAAWFMGVRLRHTDGVRSEVSLPYSWRSQNPFRSTYFAAQCAAGELATGILGLAALQGQPPVSMLVLNLEAAFYKKVNQTLLFHCDQGEMVKAAVQQTLDTDMPQVITLTATGCLPDGGEAARVQVTWSFKKK
ncbi:MAG: DUF4442 domain-containing protein [Lewinellaceae bacterium]|nr:DUF4442 domain-containing protein [Lewinellaceae bacterium]